MREVARTISPLGNASCALRHVVDLWEAYAHLKGGVRLVEIHMNPEAVDLRPSRVGRKTPRIASETWALLGLIVAGVMALAWFAFFALVNARAIGLL